MHATLVTFFEIPFEKKRRRQATYRLLSINRNIQYIPLVMDPHYIADDTYMRTLEDEEFVLRERDISLHKKKNHLARWIGCYFLRFVTRPWLYT